MTDTLPILIVGGFGASWHAYQPFQRVLEAVSKRRTFITRLATMDWMSVVVSDDYSTVLKRLNTAILDTLRRTQAQQLMLVAHSAGGILSRIYLGDQPYGAERLVFNGFQRVKTLVTLGTPHTTTRTGRFGGMNQIAFAQTRYPGAYWRFIHYITVISKGILGNKEGTPPERNAWDSYMMLSDNGNQWGDGIVPLSCGVLDGAHTVIVEGLRHDQLPDERVWYGHDETTIKTWWSHVEQVERAEQSPTNLIDVTPEESRDQHTEPKQLPPGS